MVPYIGPIVALRQEAFSSPTESLAPTQSSSPGVHVLGDGIEAPNRCLQVLVAVVVIHEPAQVVLQKGCVRLKPQVLRSGSQLPVFARITKDAWGPHDLKRF